jgi:hypothetical protein
MSRAKTRREMEVAKIKRLVSKVLRRLPDDVYAYVMDHCLFIHFFEEDHGLSMDSEGRWVIVLKIPYDPDEMPATVAHEIAHAFLRHHHEHPRIEEEVAAATLAQQWGFIGAGANPDHQRWIWRDEAEF